MPYSIDISGLNELTKKLEKAGKDAEKIASGALYKGAGMMADALDKEIRGIKTEPFKYAKDGKMRKPSPEEKAILQNAKHGIAKFRKNRTAVDTSVGFQAAGYAELKGKTVPVGVIANSINHGTSFMSKQPFARKAFKQTEPKVQDTMAKQIEEEIEKILNE